MAKILDILPSLYSEFFPAFFQNEVPPEKKATCGSCAMCESTCGNPVESVDGAKRFFRPDTKCCTYHPSLPNYLVGALLSDESPEMAEGRARLRQMIAVGESVTPTSVRAPVTYHLLYQNAQNAFGKTPTLRCPFYQSEGGLCTVWRYREAVCSTFFCKYDAGADGRKFWSQVKSYLSLSEIQLSRYAILKLHPDYIRSEKYKETAQALTVNALEHKAPDEDEYFNHWGLWMGREEEYYRQCYRVVKELTPEQFTQILGFDGVIWESHLSDAYETATSPVLPRRLKLNPGATTRWMNDGSVALASYSDVDAISIPRKAFELLTDFNGSETVEDVRENWKKEKFTDLSDELLITLYQHRILTSAHA